MKIETQLRSADLKDIFRATGTRARGRRGILLTKKADEPPNGTITPPAQSSKTTKSSSRYSIGMFSAGEARCDRWQEMAHAAQTLVAQSSSGASTKEKRAEVEAFLAPLSVLETFHAYPGEAMMNALKESLSRSDYSGFWRITAR